MDYAASGAIGGASQGAGIGAVAGPYGALLGGVVGGAVGLLGAGKAADAQYRQMMEAIRRMKVEQAKVTGEAQVAVNASGVEGSSASLQTYLSSMSAEMRRQLDWTRATGGAQIKNTMEAGTWGALSDWGAAIAKFGQATNWGKTSP